MVLGVIEREMCRPACEFGGLVEGFLQRGVHTSWIPGGIQRWGALDGGYISQVFGALKGDALVWRGPCLKIFMLQFGYIQLPILDVDKNFQVHT
jgi:hypothetical protein